MKRILLAGLAAMSVVGTASAADVGVLPPALPVPVPVVQVPYNWTGCYVGGFIGAAWGGVNVTDANSFAGAAAAAFDSWSYRLGSSFIGGGTGGCNWQPLGSPMVLGVEGEVGYIDLIGSGYDSRFPAPFGSNFLLASTQIGSVYGMITGRLGYTFDRALFYIKGGAAFVDESLTVAHSSVAGLGIPAFTATSSDDIFRWTIGAGVEWAFAGNWTIKGEYMFIGTDYGSACGTVTANSVPGLAGTYCWNPTGLSGVSTAKIGINYLFGGGGVPLYARY